MLELDSTDALSVLEEQEELGFTAIDLSLPPRITQVIDHSRRYVSTYDVTVLRQAFRK